MKKHINSILLFTGVAMLVIMTLQYNYLKKIEYNLRSMNIKADRQSAIRLSDLEDSYKGKSNAPIEFIMFSDFECHYCRVFEQEILPIIEEEYIETGKVKFVYKHFPLGYHKLGLVAAEISEMAKEKGKFWEMHDFLYAGTSLEDQLTKVIPFSKYKLGIDSVYIQEQLQAHNFMRSIKDDERHGLKAGIDGTPGFVINNRVYSGFRNVEEFKEILNRTLEEVEGK